jgi:hypothetical protein
VPRIDSFFRMLSGHGKVFRLKDFCERCARQTPTLVKELIAPGGVITTGVDASEGLVPYGGAMRATKTMSPW